VKRFPCSRAPGSRRGALPLVASVVFLSTGLPNHAAPGVVISKTPIQSARPPAWRSVIITGDGPLASSQEARLRQLGGDVYRHLPLIRGAAVRVPERSLAMVSRLSFVRHISPDLSVRKSDEFTVASSGAGVAFQQYGVTGSGIGVAVIDSGVRSSIDLGNPATGSSRIVASVGYVPSAAIASDPNGHGTHVAGIVAGNGAGSTGSSYFRTFYGIARNTNIVSVRVLDNTGAGTVSNVIAGLQWAVNNRAAYNIRVINLSLGHPVGESYTTDPLCQAVEAAWKSGIVVVCAAGNDGRKSATPTAGAPNEGYGTNFGSIQSPANDPYVITVGASKSVDGNRANDRIATYSARGPSRLDFVLKPDIIAPGNRVISLAAAGSYLEDAYPDTNNVPWTYFSNNNGSANSKRYFWLSGTSMSAPVVAGAAALMLQANPTLTPDVIKARLMVSADKWAYVGGVTDVCTYGAGYLNIPAALASTAMPTRYALSPTLSRDVTGKVYLNSVFIVQGTQYIWGDSAVPNSQYVWGDQYIWGDDALPNSQYIWGDSVWADQYIWGDTSTSVDLSARVINGEP
jgi:serine protease AprX